MDTVRPLAGSDLAQDCCAKEVSNPSFARSEEEERKFRTWLARERDSLLQGLNHHAVRMVRITQRLEFLKDERQAYTIFNYQGQGHPYYE